MSKRFLTLVGSVSRRPMGTPSRSRLGNDGQYILNEYVTQDTSPAEIRARICAGLDALEIAVNREFGGGCVGCADAGRAADRARYVALHLYYSTRVAGTLSTAG